MTNVIYFCLLVGIGSTIVLDIWVTLVEKILSIPPTNWGLVGKWIKGILKGNWVLDTSDNSSPSFSDKALGWFFHYAIGVGYAALILIFFGTTFISAPTVMPVVVIGLLLSTIAGLAVLMPGLGAGFMGRLVPNWFSMFAYLFIAHGVFAISQYVFALIYA